MNVLYKLVDEYLLYSEDALTDLLTTALFIGIGLVLLLGLFIIVMAREDYNSMARVGIIALVIVSISVGGFLLYTPKHFENNRTTIEEDIMDLLVKNTEEVSIDQSSVTLDRCDDFKGCVEINDNRQEPIILVMDSDNLHNLDHTKELILIVPKLDFAERYMLESSGLSHVIAKSIEVKKQ